MGFNVCHFGSRANGCQDEFAQRFDIGYADMHQIVVGAANVVRRDNWWQRAAVLSKPVNDIARMARESYGDERLQCRADGPGCDIGVVPPQYAARFESAHTGERAGFSQPNARCQLFVGQPCILL